MHARCAHRPSPDSSCVTTSVSSHRRIRSPGLAKASKKNEVSAVDAAALNALNGALQTVSKFIQEGENRRKARKQAALNGATEPQTDIVERKNVKFNASGKNERLIKEALKDLRPGYALRDYLMLPLDQYSLLDPTWITRDPAVPELFKLKVPLDELVGVDLQPQMDVRVTIDEKEQLVNFSADGFKLGDPKFDENFEIDMKAVLKSKPVLDVGGISLSNLWGGSDSKKEAEKAAKEAEEEAARLKRQNALLPTRAGLGLPPLSDSSVQTSTSASASGSGQESGESTTGDQSLHTDSKVPPLTVEDVEEKEAINPMSEVPTSALCCSVDVSFRVVCSPPMTSVPGPLLSMTGGLIAKLAMNSLLPAFLELLSVDYGRWASGLDGARTDKVGSLVQQRRKSVYHQSPKGSTETGARTGSAVSSSTTGDAEGTSFIDVIIGTNNENGNLDSRESVAGTQRNGDSKVDDKVTVSSTPVPSDSGN